MAPDWRAISSPERKAIMVGMPRMPSLVESCWFASELSLTNRSAGSRAFAAFSYSGAMARHGPHQGAQTSTTTGSELLVSCRSNMAASMSAGTPVNKGRLHLPHFAFKPSLSPGRRLTAPQCTQTTVSSLFISQNQRLFVDLSIGVRLAFDLDRGQGQTSQPG